MRYNVLQLLTYASLASSGLVMPLFAAELGASIQFIGWIGAAFGLASFVSSVVFGRLGDRVDRRLILRWGFVANAFALALQALSDSPTTFLLTRFIAGFLLGIIPPTLAAYVYDIRRPMGRFTSYNAMGWLLASLLVVGMGWLAASTFRHPQLESARTFIVDRLGVYEFIFLSGALLCLLGLSLTRGVPPMRVALNVPLLPWRLVRNNLHVYLAIFLRHLGAAGIWTIYPLYILSLGGDLAMLGWVHIVNMTSQILVLRNVEQLRRIGSPRWLIGIGLALSALTFWGFTLVGTATQLLPLQIPLGVSFACLWLGSLKEVLEHNIERATATGLLNASLNLSNVAGPILGGLIAATLGFRAAINTAALLTAAAFVLYLVLARMRPETSLVVPAQVTGPTGEVTP